jgi:hypothetical protein
MPTDRVGIDIRRIISDGFFAMLSRL